MIQEIKNLGKNLVAAITPVSLASNDVHPVDVNGNYDWNAQAYRYDICNFGTSYNTQFSTGSRNGDSSSDSNPD